MLETKNKILIIEDEQDIREGIAFLLEDKYQVQTAASGVAGIKEAIRFKPDLIILDLNLPDLDGYQVCKSLREDPDFQFVPIIFLTAFNNSEDRIKAFEAGGDDYIAKPFHNNELLARIVRKLSISKSSMFQNKGYAFTANSEVLNCGNLQLSVKNQQVSVDHRSIHLSNIEFKLLHLFILNQGQLISRKTIIENIWANQSVSERVIDPHIVSLRNKLEDFNHSISAIYRGGYILK